MPLITLLKPGSLIFSSEEKQKAHAETVPIEFIVDWFKERLHKVGIRNRILILLSSTGSGKSTSLPPRLYREFVAPAFGSTKPGEGNIVVTQPRVVNAITIPKDQIAGSPFYSYMKLGENIGWQTGPSKKNPIFGLTYVTTGVLIALFKMYTDEEIMEKYKIIMIDEAHEASLDLISLLYTLKNFYKRNAENPKLPFLVIMSATIEPGKFINYFEVGGDAADPRDSPNFIQVAGFAYDLLERWDTTPVSVVNYMSAAAETVKKIHLQGLNDPEENRDILVFMPSPTEINELISRIKVLNMELLRDGKGVLLPLMIDREAVNSNNEDYRLLFMHINALRNTSIDEARILAETGGKKKRGGGKKGKDISSTDKKGKSGTGISQLIFRRVIFGTSVLETGVTLDYLKYVCDSGYYRGPEFISIYGVGGIITKPSPKSRIRQRAGRSNRKSEGEFWPLYPKYIYDALENDQLSEIQTSDISPIMLTLMNEQITSSMPRGITANEAEKYVYSVNVYQIDTIDKIPSDTIQYQLEKLYVLGFISPHCLYKFVRMEVGDDPSYMTEKIADAPRITDESAFSLTRLGQIASKFNALMPEQIKLILQTYLWDCGTLDAITIAAYMGIGYNDFKLSKMKDIDWVRIYKDGLPHYMTKGGAENLIYRVKLTIADDFISGLILFNAIGSILAGSGGDFAKLEAWCAECNLKYSGCVDFMALRDDIIEQSLQIGINPFYGERAAKIPESEFMNYIVKLKHCIFDAYRLNVAKYNVEEGLYALPSGLKITVPQTIAVNESKLAHERKYGVAQKGKPTYIICENFNIKIQRPGRKGGSEREKPHAQSTPSMYTVKTQRISVLDGYVDVDGDFV